MLITVCKSKIHRARITEANLNYVGSLTIDEDLMKLADLVEYERISIVNVNNGERFDTYVIRGEPGSGTITLNGAAARKGQPGDLIIIIAWAQIEKDEAAGFKPAVVHVDQNNRPTKK
jgi:aspartate 1-decarboxylase